MLPETTIRLAELRDAPAIGAVHVAAWHTTYRGIVAQPYIDSLSVADRAAAWDRRLRGETNPVPTVLVVEDAAGALCGFASGGPIREPQHSFDAELHAIYLLEEARGRGIGRRLVREWAAHATQSGLRSAIVGVLAANPACAFYERLGARPLTEGVCQIGGVSYPERWYGWDDLHTLRAGEP